MKFLINRMHGGSSWLYKKYPIHVVYIQRLTGLSIVGIVVSTYFQNASKRGEKTSDDNYYNMYGTQRGGKGAMIE